MKKFILFISTLALLTATAAPQAVIENPAKPTNGNSGRIVTLKEEMRIEDTGGSFFFKFPYTIRISPKGDIFIQDGKQALQFDPQGRFIRNLLKEGQGPRELSSLADIWASQDRVFLMGFPPKIQIFNYEGNLIKEINPLDPGSGPARFVLADAGNILMTISGRPDISTGSGLINIGQNIIEIAPEGVSAKSIGSFPLSIFIQTSSGGAGGVSGGVMGGSMGGTIGGGVGNPLQTVPLDEKTIFLNYTSEYRVEVFDREKGAVIRRFNRPYSRVKKIKAASDPSRPGLPEDEFKNDIYALHVNDGKIWVQTSTVDADKGILFDVFNPEGRYLDSFFIQISKKDTANNPVNTRLTIAGGFVYYADKTEDDLLVIKKCRLVGL